MFHKRSLQSQDSPDPPVEVKVSDTSTSRRVGRVAPSLQSSIDRKAYQDLALDFPSTPLGPPRHTSTQAPRPSSTPRVEGPPESGDSDFESPNLLARTVARRPLVTKNLLKKGGKEVKAEVNSKIEKKAKELIEDALKKPEIKKELSIENHDSSVEVVETEKEEKKGEVEDKVIEDFASPIKKKKSVNSKKAVNRWGMEVEETSDSARKRLRNQRQSKLDGYFKNPPQAREDREGGEFKRISHVDTDMERALQLSRDQLKAVTGPAPALSREQLKAVMVRVDEEMEEEEAEVQNLDPNSPVRPHIGPTVRGREERQKLLGFDCGECAEYYQAKLEEGLSKDQIIRLLNQCSRHRGLFRPPLTPPKFWDPDMDDDTQDPRNRTQAAAPLRSRAKMRLERRARE